MESVVTAHRVQHPQSAADRWLDQTTGEGLLVLDFPFRESWETRDRLLRLLVWRQADGRCRFSIVPAEDAPPPAGSNAAGAFRQQTLASEAPALELGFPLALDPVTVAKPWGREIWYSGIEQRGVSRVGDGERWLPLSWLLAALPGVYGSRAPVLLKVLDPLPEPVFGDLYFELHREKREVYVVTAVDREAWPDGVGAIRFGFDPEVRARYTDDAAFRRAYLSAVADYRALRRDIDQRLDRRREAEGVALDAPLPAKQLARWLNQEVPAQLREREASARRAMEAFTRLRPLRVGDVVRVPLLTPHALQHGVRSVEFQTPVYERLILSFAQKVLTQNEWDTEAAAGLMKTETAEEAPLPEVRNGTGWREQRIVDFPDFEAFRLCFEETATAALPSLAAGGVAMAVGGEVALDRLTLPSEGAALLPLGYAPTARARRGATLLWAQPAVVGPFS